MSNEIRSDAVMVKVFYKNCSIQETCRITDKSEELSRELERKILQTAAAYSEQDKSKNKKKYINKALQN